MYVCVYMCIYVSMYYICMYVVPANSHIPFSLSELASMAAVLRDVFVTLHMEKHLPPTYSLSRASTAPTKPHPQVCLLPHPSRYYVCVFTTRSGRS